MRMDCERLRGAEGGGIAALSSIGLVAMPMFGLVGLETGKLEAETSLLVLSERGVS